MRFCPQVPEFLPDLSASALRLKSPVVGLAQSAVASFVLVCGVAQIALGLGQSLLATTVPARRTIVTELVAFNAGCALVLAGTVAERLLVTDAGGALLALALVSLFREVGGASVRATWAVNLYAR